MERGPKGFREFSGKEIDFLRKNIKADSVILDVGCGWGKHISILSKNARVVFGIDSSVLMIKKAKEYLMGLKNVKLFLDDAEEMPFEDNFFDFVICTRNTFGNMYNRRAVLREMKRVLKRTGKMFIGVYSEQAKDLQLEYYKANGIKVIHITKSCVYALPDFKSGRFTKQRLKDIFKAGGLSAKIMPLNCSSHRHIAH